MNTIIEAVTATITISETVAGIIIDRDDLDSTRPPSEENKTIIKAPSTLYKLSVRFQYFKHTFKTQNSIVSDILSKTYFLY